MCRISTSTDLAIDYSHGCRRCMPPRLHVARNVAPMCTWTPTRLVACAYAQRGFPLTICTPYPNAYIEAV